MLCTLRSAVTENTRASYPIHYIDNARIPCLGPHPKNLILLCCDAFGVLPPVSRLTKEQAMYHFISGYTAKVRVRGMRMPVGPSPSCLARCAPTTGQPPPRSLRGSASYGAVRMALLATVLGYFSNNGDTGVWATEQGVHLSWRHCVPLCLRGAP